MPGPESRPPIYEHDGKGDENDEREQLPGQLYCLGISNRIKSHPLDVVLLSNRCIFGHHILQSFHHSVRKKEGQDGSLYL